MLWLDCCSAIYDHITVHYWIAEYQVKELMPSARLVTFSMWGIRDAWTMIVCKDRVGSVKALYVEVNSRQFANIENAL